MTTRKRVQWIAVLQFESGASGKIEHRGYVRRSVETRFVRWPHRLGCCSPMLGEKRSVPVASLCGAEWALEASGPREPVALCVRLPSNLNLPRDRYTKPIGRLGELGESEARHGAV